MSVRANVDLVFGIDMPSLEYTDAMAEAEKLSTTVSINYLSGEGRRPRDGGVVYARASERRLVVDRDVPVPVLDVARVGTGVDTAAWIDNLRQFADEHGLPWSEPRWLVVSNVC